MYPIYKRPKDDVSDIPGNEAVIRRKKDLVLKTMKELGGMGVDVVKFANQIIDAHLEEVDEKEMERTAQKQHNVTLLAKFQYPMCCRGHGINAGSVHFGGKKCIQCGHSNAVRRKRLDTQAVTRWLREYQKKMKGSKGKEVNLRDYWSEEELAQNKYPLHIAVTKGDIDSVRRLCRQNRRLVNQVVVKLEWTPLLYASWPGQLECAIELIMFGANAFPTPNTRNHTPYAMASAGRHKNLETFFKDFAAFQFGVNAEDEMWECRDCFGWDRLYNKEGADLTMARYVVCSDCFVKNKKTVKDRVEANKREEKRITLALKYNPSISIDTLCGMRDKKALEALLRDIGAMGDVSRLYCLWLFDIDAFKSINTALTHDVADEQVLKPMGEVFKKYDVQDPDFWQRKGIAVSRAWVFRQGGDEFSMITERPHDYPDYRKGLPSQQKLYNELKRAINSIEIRGKRQCVDPKRNDFVMKHVTLSTGVYVCDGSDYKRWLLKADEMAERVKAEGKDGLRVMVGEWETEQNGGVFKDFVSVK